MKQLEKITTGLTILVTGAVLEFQGGFKIGYGGATWKDFSALIVGALLTTSSSLFLFGVSPTGWILGLSTSIVIALASVKLGQDAKLGDMVKNVFYGAEDTVFLKDMILEIQDPQVDFSKLPSNLQALFDENEPISLSELKAKIHNMNLSVDNPEQYIKDAFYRGSETITITDLSIAFKDFVSPMISEAEGIAVGQKAIDSLRQTVQSTNTEIGKVSSMWQAGLLSGEEYVEEIVPLLEQLKTDTGDILDQIFDNIVLAVGGSFGKALEEANIAVPQALTKLGEIRDASKTGMERATDEWLGLQKILADNKTLTDEQFTRLVELEKKLGLNKDVAEEAKQTWDGVKQAIGSINFESPEAIDKAFATITNSANTAREAVSSSIASWREGLEEYKKWTDDPETHIYLDEMIKMREDFGVEQIETMNTELMGIFNAMQEQLMANTTAQVAKATEEWNNMNMWERLFAGDRDTYISKALQNYNDNIVVPITEKIKTTMEELGIAGEPWAEDAMKVIMDSLFSYDIYDGTATYVGTMTSEAKTQLEKFGMNAQVFAESAGIMILDGVGNGIDQKKTGWVDRVFGWLPTNLKKFFGGLGTSFVGYGKDLVDGLKKGIEGTLKDNWFTKTFGKIGSIFEKDYEINSPSRVFKRYGSDISEGLRLGIDENINQSDYDYIFARVANSVEDVFETRSPSRFMMRIGGFLSEGLFQGLRESMIPENVSSLIYEPTNEIVSNLVNDSTRKFGTMENKISRSLRTLGDSFTSSFSQAIIGMTGLEKIFVESESPIVNALQGITRELINMAAQKAFSWVLKTGLNVATGGSFGLISKGASWLKNLFFADGGFPQQGQLFVAREAGPELVGSIGGRTAVANNDQIVQAVSQGVYQAVVSALSNQPQGGGTTEVRVFLDGRDITRSVETEQRERGLDLMPGGVWVG